MDPIEFRDGKVVLLDQTLLPLEVKYIECEDLGCVAEAIRKLRVRVKHGVREELLPLVRLKGIGRARARMLFNSGFRSLDSLRKAPLESIERVVGPSAARKVKEQL